jgi:hypothetical protein
MLVERSGRSTTCDLALAGVYIWTNTIFFQKYVARVSAHVPVLAAAFVAAEILLVWLMIGAPLTRLAAIVDRRRFDDSPWGYLESKSMTPENGFSPTC